MSCETQTLTKNCIVSSMEEGVLYNPAQSPEKLPKVKSPSKRPQQSRSLQLAFVTAGLIVFYFASGIGKSGGQAIEHAIPPSKPVETRSKQLDVPPSEPSSKEVAPPKKEVHEELVAESRAPFVPQPGRILARKRTVKWIVELNLTSLVMHTHPETQKEEDEVEKLESLVSLRKPAIADVRGNLAEAQAVTHQEVSSGMLLICMCGEL